MPGSLAAMSEWHDTGRAYAESFALLTAGAVPALLDALAARVPRGRFLDVGAGSGVIAAAAQARGFDVSAAEPEASMRAVLRDTHPRLDVLEAGLPDLPIADEAYDAVSANFVLNHVADPRASAAELARVTRPGGAVAATIWPAGASPLRPIWEAMSAVTPGGSPPNALPPERDFSRTPAGLATLFEGAGLRDVSAHAVEWTWSVAPTLLWRALEGGIATIGNLYRRSDVATRARMREVYDSESARRADAVSGLLVLPHTALLATGTR